VAGFEVIAVVGTTALFVACRGPTHRVIARCGPVLAVKIDNIADARPPENLTSADIVYLLPVEGGLSRIFAVYSSRIPTVIGPVRSAREDDLALLRQFGKPGFAYSGATPHLLPFIARARVVNLSVWPSVTSVLVTVKLGTTGKRANGSFMFALHK
jgi:hypothetical protein